MRRTQRRGGHRAALRTTSTAAATALVIAGTAAAAPAASATHTVVATGTAHAAARAPGPSFRLADIPMKDGVVLKANVFSPASGTPGADARGRYPVIVQPASWGQNDIEYVLQGKRLAAAGYVVVTYTVRGFWLSGGEVDVAGPKDVADISAVIDWAIARTPADPRRIGMTGLSLGGGLTLLGAAADPRIKAVAAMSGWGDLVDSLYSGETRHLQAVAALTAVQTPTGRQSAELRGMLSNLFADRDTPDVIRWAQTRSPGAYADRINANGTAVFLASAWGDSIFNPSQITAFYQKLTGPKRIEMRPGDHATQEFSGLLGLDNATWASALRWFDEHLMGHGGSAPRPPVELEVRPSGARESYPSWQAVGSRTERLRLGRANAFGTGALGTGATVGTGWRTSVVGGLNSGADGGITELSGLLDQFIKLPPVVAVPLLPRRAAAVWQSEPYAAGRHIRGVVRLHTTVTSSAPQGTVIGHLYDVNSLGLGKLISHAPQSWKGRTPRHAFPLDIQLFATAYDLPAGHRLALVLDTQDPLYGGRTPTGSKVTFGSPEDDPSEVVLPLR
ncbi:putative CocE/NonD family hydrolase [Streptomyces sp. SLBN-118]|uniref:CocE/NonD family hydrolase n=1 Tax=Streptomyces sp. SLBN-118 TaxID=2768454 RepID=UPI00114E8DB8|nr:CocE/NonD family hydrolase [Streptomyces sp. SLBN-118]TQK50219.1 putative CocE/NonD family hydrolase [Streptomyces sp. SLBN-118]